MSRAVAVLLALICGPVAAEPPEYEQVLDQCLACHLQEDGSIDIVGLRAIAALPEEWPFLYEDAFDLDGDGIAGRLRLVSGENGALIARFGQSLSAARFEDFAMIAGAAHGIDGLDPEAIAYLRREFERRSPDPTSPFTSPQERAAFEARGCAACHVTDSYDFEGRQVSPLSDFLLHDMGDGPRRTQPLWGCLDCVQRGRNPHSSDPHDR